MEKQLHDTINALQAAKENKEEQEENTVLLEHHFKAGKLIRNKLEQNP